MRAAIALLLLAGCSTCPDLVNAERKTFDAIAPEYAAYVEADASLSRADKDTKLATVAGWDRTLTIYEASR